MEELKHTKTMEEEMREKKKLLILYNIVKNDGVYDPNNETHDAEFFEFVEDSIENNWVTINGMMMASLYAGHSQKVDPDFVWE